MLTLTCSGQSYSQQLNYSSLHRNWWVAYNDTSAGYVTDTGFFRRPDVREPNGYYSYTFRPSHGFILSHGPSIYGERIWDHTGTPLDAYINPAYSVSFKYRTSVSAYVDLGQDRLRPVDYPALPQRCGISQPHQRSKLLQFSRGLISRSEADIVRERSSTTRRRAMKGRPR